jgi:lauroyl/myristoyl acyltransferase
MRTKLPSPKNRLKFRFLCSKIVAHYYIKCMTKKKNVADKVLSIRVPTELFDKFKALCDQNYKTMSDTLRDFIRDYAKQGNK